VRYPGAVIDPDTGELISDAEVAEVEFTAFASTRHAVTARLVVRRVRDRAPARALALGQRVDQPTWDQTVESWADQRPHHALMLHRPSQDR
jgi:hypothetical protein